MTGRNASSDQNAVSRFWHNHLSILERSAIPKGARRWYRKHAEAYIRANKDIRLSQHSPQHVENYLNAKDSLRV
jgi:hypothetical protein